MKKNLVTLLTAVALLISGAAYAQDNDWNVTLIPYGWLAGLEGDTGVKPLVADVDLSPSDILDNLEVAGMFTLDANNGTWGMVADVFYVELEDSATTAIGKIKAEVEQWIVTAGAYYRIPTENDLVVDVGAGGRYMNADTDVTTPMGTSSDTEDWIDPVLTLNLKVPVAERCFLNVYGDIGGFGVESDLTWLLMGAAGYSITERMDLLVAYKHLDVDYENGGFVYDAATSGFAIGLSISL
jgi:hypothetical protein